ncbi:outer membrane beta-barrel protein [Hyphomicrobium sp.]|uniref:outer membrane beta-barrel protein n=1 Tax=Hyphomicrobium sp. TaxID=82 RepID=UPI002D77E4EB|nr:outer membrane beta-barrel protein [Hyphomicrobium sp.]HET6390334.1 outer membrane beta-barrel protein [Hyphomicrobium sp.]
MVDRLSAWLISGIAVALVSVLGQPVRAQNMGPSGIGTISEAYPNASSQQANLQSDQDEDAEASDGQALKADRLDGLDETQPLDGDAGLSADPSGIVDGGIDTMSEPAQSWDGDVMSRGAPADNDDAMLVENPPAGYDPLLFQIEDLDPYTDNRTTRRLFRQEPYDPVGIKVGSFVLFPEVEFGTSYYSNIFHAPGSPSDWALDVNPGARLVSNWGRHALELRGVGQLSFFDEYLTEDDRDYTLEARGRLDITKRSNLQALVSRQQYLEDRSALDASSVGTRSVVRTDRAEAAYNQRFNRLSYQLRGSVQDYSFGATQYGGVTTPGRDRDYTVYEETVRTSWEFKPSFSPYLEFAYNHRDYAEAAQSDLINRTSNGQRYRVGVSFGNTGEILRGDISLGYGVQTPEDARLRSVDGLTIDANATWRVSDLTSVLFNANTDVSETTTAYVGGAFYRSLGLEVRHQLRSYLVATAGLVYSNQNSQDGVIDDTLWSQTAGIEYYANRNTVLYGKYQHVNFNGIGAANDYVGDEVHVGVRLRQ